VSEFIFSRSLARQQARACPTDLNLIMDDGQRASTGSLIYAHNKYIDAGISQKTLVTIEYQEDLFTSKINSSGVVSTYSSSFSRFVQWFFVF
jgi:hypothetical protein